MGCCVKSNWDTNSCTWNKNYWLIFFRERFTTKIFKGLGWSNANLRLIYFTLKSNALSKERFFGLWTPEWWQSGSGIKRGRKETMVIPHHYIPTRLHCLLSNAQKNSVYIKSSLLYSSLSPFCSRWTDWAHGKKTLDSFMRPERDGWGRSREGLSQMKKNFKQ